MPVVAVCLAERGNAVNVGHPRTRGAGGTAEADGDAGRHARQVRDKRGAWLRTYHYPVSPRQLAFGTGLGMKMAGKAENVLGFLSSFLPSCLLFY